MLNSIPEDLNHHAVYFTPKAERRAVHPKTILILNRFYLPGYRAGGPIKSIVNLQKQLSTNFNIKIFTLNHDSRKKDCYTEITSNTWVNYNHGEVYYSRPGKGLIIRIIKETYNHRNNYIYLNSFFDPLFSFLPLLVMGLLGRSHNVRIAPRGEVANGALSLKAAKKHRFLTLSRTFGLHKNLTWHATSEEEAGCIEDLFPVSTKIHNIENLPDPPLDYANTSYPNKQVGQMRVVFLSRITPKKNLLTAIKAMSQVKFHKIVFDIFGPISDTAYWEECLALINTMPDNIEINYCGEITPSQVKATLIEYELFFLPTRNENYGHAIAEALSCGCPVLLSDQTPWEKVVPYGIGWVGGVDDYCYFAEKIEALAEQGAQEWLKRRENCIKFMTLHIDGQDFNNKYSALFS